MARPSPSLFAGAALLVVLVLCNFHVDAFVVVPKAADRPPCAAGDQPSSTFLIRQQQPFAASMPKTTSGLYMATGGGKKKRRRKRKDSADASAASSQQKPDTVPVVNDEGDLPTFDLGDDEQVEEFKTEPAVSSASASASTSDPSSPMASTSASSAPGDASANQESVDMSDPKVLEAMRGSQRTAASGGGSMDELLSNRELEKLLKFDDSAVKEDLPSLGQLASKGGGGGSGASASSPDSGASSGSFVVEQKVGSKRARAEARRAAAIEAEKAAEEEKGFLEQFPQLLDEKGQVSPLKILESGTWFGIGILVAWEAYINSPFFERSAPMAPVVYELLF